MPIVQGIVALVVVIIGLLLVLLGALAGWPSADQLGARMAEAVSRWIGRNIFTGEKL